VRLFARFVLGAVTVAYVVEMLVGRLLVYELVTAIAFYLCIALLVWFAWRAREWLASSARERLGGRVGDIAAYLCGDWRVVVFGIPVALALAVAAALRYAIEVGSEFDFGKRLSARMFIRRAQAQKRAGHSPASQPLPADYVASFDLYHTPEPEMLVEPETGDYEGLRANVESWRGGDDTTNSLALFGHKGTGKSTLLERLGSDWGELRVIAGKVHGKCTKVDDVAKLFGDLLQCDMSSGMGGFLESVAKMPPTLVLLDDAHNLVLRTQGGFGGFRLLASLINANTPNLYWCAAFNLYPWRYLENVFAQELPFRSTHAVHGWSDTDIERLITRRHASTGYRLRFDDVILASDNEAHDYVESRFFQVLWEQSHGIPRSALALWRRSLLYNGSRTLRVTLPEIGDASRASSLSTEALFVLAAVVRHENLTATEAMEVTGISQSLVRHALSSARELGLVERGEDRRYRVAPDWYALLARVLSDRNLIYE
jgi:DNA-binding transcriptional ArsR family regulator